MLEELTPAALVLFMEQVEAYELQHGEPVLAATFVGNDIIVQSSVKNRQVINKLDFWKQSNKDLFHFLKCALLPRTQMEWIQFFKVAVCLKSKNCLSNINVTEWTILYEDIVHYASNFLAVYKLMLPDDAQIKSHIVPSFNSVARPPGKHDLESVSLVGLFNECLPAGFGPHFFHLFYPANINKSCPHIIDIPSFVQDFMDKMCAYHNLSVSLRPLAAFMNNNRRNSRIARGDQVAPRVQNLVPTGEVSSEVFDSLDTGSEISSDGEIASEEVDDAVIGDEGDNASVDDHYGEQLIYNLIKEKTPCYAFCQQGKCLKGATCKFSHDPKVISQERKRMKERLQELLADDQPRAICMLRREEKRKVDKKHKKSLKSSKPLAKDSIAGLLAVLGSGDEASKRTGRSAVHVDAQVLGLSSLVKAKLLLDSGAIGDNYMTLDFYKLHETDLSTFMKPAKGGVMVADGKTVLDILGEVVIHLLFEEIGGKVRLIELKFMVYDAVGTSQDMIIGLNSLLGECFGLFMDVLCEARKNVNGQVFTLVEPFSTVPEPTPEDALYDTIPVNFADYLHYMECDYQTALNEYIASIPTQCSAEMLASVDLHGLLVTKGAKVFVPSNWEGIKDVVIQLGWKSTPPRRKPPTRQVNPKLLETAKLEFERLKKYMYEESSSEVVSPLVIAPKATKPFVRFCGGYTWVNKFIEVGHYPIPHVMRSLEKIANFKYFIDLDLCNAFHQFKLGEVSSERLSIQTPWGCVKPRFMPEGVGPATGILQKYMEEIFSDFDPWSIVLFDNILLLCDTYEDGLVKLEKFLDRCIEKNIVLKFSKSFIGVQEVNFFGYLCRHGTFGIAPSRISAIKDIPIPKDKKSMQSFLGTVVFTQPFTPDFAKIAAPLYNATTSKFDWNNEAMVKSLEYPFEALKEAIAGCLKLYYPDYSLRWFLRSDASDVGCGYVLFQVTADDVIQPLAFGSHKFSPAATRWSIIERECFACHWAIQSNEYFLRCKDFVLQTDHRNLQWMQTSNTPKVVRWFTAMQSFNFMVEHIPGRNNRVADLLSRIHVLTSDAVHLLEQVHGGRAGHFGVERTWFLLNELFPNHGIQKDEVAEFVRNCDVCQKFRLQAKSDKPPVLKTLKADNHRSVIACDTLEVTKDDLGNRYIIVVVNLYTKFVHLYPVPDKTAETVAMCLLQFFASYGLFNVVHSDPGNEFQNDVIKLLLQWLGPTQTVTLVNNPQADGVERANYEVLKLLRMIVADERLSSKWSDMSVLPWVQLQINSWVNSNTGYSAFDLQYGSLDSAYFDVPLDSHDVANAFVSKLNENLLLVRQVVMDKKASIKRNKKLCTDPDALDPYTSGDYVFYIIDSKLKVGNKLKSRKRGPYEVVAHEKGSNYVTVKSLITQKVTEFNQKDLKRFVGSKEAAFAMAQLDDDQYIVKAILGYSGDVEKRSTTKFLVEYVDGDCLWVMYSPDIAETNAFELFCKRSVSLSLLLLHSEEVKRVRREVMLKPIDMTMLGKNVWVNLRVWGDAFYDSLTQLVDRYKKDYLVAAKVVKANQASKDYKLSIPALSTSLLVNNWFLYLHYSLLEPADEAVVVDAAFVQKYSIVLR
ncbi:MAG: RNase H-like domain-containing protein [Candidatus Brocadiales bacterium]|nr:RNase H-like domain-containing protein [Candidatus Brocadiales bacterium]